MREWLRPVIAAWVAGARDVPGKRALARLNASLAADSRHAEITRTGDRLAVADHRTWDTPGALLVPPAHAAADLLAHGDPALVRNCEGPACTLRFYDRTKAHQRRWCSMAVCANRAKARAHRERQSGERSVR